MESVECVVVGAGVVDAPEIAAGLSAQQVRGDQLCGVPALFGGRDGDTLTGGTGADKFGHLGISPTGHDHGVDYITDYSYAQGDMVRGASYQVVGKNTLVFEEDGDLIFVLQNYNADTQGIAFLGSDFA